ncbi:MAG: error-prone DNA polymerase [Acidobacteriota bacterium]
MRSELHCRSCFSFLQGASAPEALVEVAQERGITALALTDVASLSGLPRFVEATAGTTVRPIVGCELELDVGGHVVLLVRDADGYRQLSRLISRAQARRPKGEAAADWELLSEHARGLFVLTGWKEGSVLSCLRRHDHVGARRLLGQLREIFGRDRCFLEIQRHLEQGERQWIADLASLSRQLEVPLVATGGVRFARREDKDLHDVLTCIRHHCSLNEAGTLLLANAEHQLRDEKEMKALFAEFPGALKQAETLAEACRFELDEIDCQLPSFPVPDGESTFSYLHRLVHEGARTRYRPLTARVSRQLSHELDVIEKLGLAGYFLIVWEIVETCRQAGILCQGRGSAANSVVCYCLGITSVDPVGRGLLFERFLSAGRTGQGEPPDIDLDIAHRHREEIIQHVYRRYGRDHAAMACEKICFRSRSAVRDVSKALGLQASEVNGLSKVLGGRGRLGDPSELGELVSGEENGEVLRELVRLCREIDDLPRHLGIHVGGMVISREPLSEVVPIEPATMADRTVVQWDKDDLNARGIVKIDLLGLGMLTLLQEAFRFIEERHGRRLELSTIPLDDPAVFELLEKADTVGIFQVESRAQMSTLPRMKPKSFHDLVIEVSLIRPGPIQGDLVHPYLRRRNGEEAITYPHESLEPVLARTLGVPLFQEQGMRLAMVAGGFTPEEADELRKALGHSRAEKKIVPLLARLEQGMKDQGYSDAARATVLRQVESFAHFGFAESHAASFAILVNASAWLKVHYPVEFTAALLHAQPMGFYSIGSIAEDARRRGIEVLPIDVNSSTWETRVVRATTRPEQGSGLRHRVPEEGNGTIRLGLRFLRGLAEGLRPRAERLASQAPFESLADYVRRSGLPRSVLETLAAAGAFGSFGLERRQAQWEVSRLCTSSELGPLWSGQDLPEESDTTRPPEPDLVEQTVLDYRLIGVPSSVHPLQLLREELRAQDVLSSTELAETAPGTVVESAGLVICRQRPATAKGVLFLTLEDEEGFINLIVREKTQRRHRALLRRAVLLQARGKLQREGAVVQVVAEDFAPLDLPGAGRELPESSRDFR